MALCARCGGLVPEVHVKAGKARETRAGLLCFRCMRLPAVALAKAGQLASAGAAKARPAGSPRLSGGAEARPAVASWRDRPPSRSGLYIAVGSVLFLLAAGGLTFLLVSKRNQEETAREELARSLRETRDAAFKYWNTHLEDFEEVLARSEEALKTLQGTKYENEILSLRATVQKQKGARDSKQELEKKLQALKEGASSSQNPQDLLRELEQLRTQPVKMGPEFEQEIARLRVEVRQQAVRQTVLAAQNYAQANPEDVDGLFSRISQAEDRAEEVGTEARKLLAPLDALLLKAWEKKLAGGAEPQGGWIDLMSASFRTVKWSQAERAADKLVISADPEAPEKELFLVWLDNPERWRDMDLHAEFTILEKGMTLLLRYTGKSGGEGCRIDFDTGPESGLMAGSLNRAEIRLLGTQVTVGGDPFRGDSWDLSAMAPRAGTVGFLLDAGAKVAFQSLKVRVLRR